MNTPKRPRAGHIELAPRMSGVVPSAVREILKVAERPEVMSFAGGLPAPELFPVQEIARAFNEVLATDGPGALQYGVTEGYGPLREWIMRRLQSRGVDASVERLLITAGSQQGIDLVARVLLGPGDTVIVENPSYLAALQVFSMYEANVVAVPSDDQGMRVDLLEEVFLRQKPALLYIVPEFQNPKGTSLAHDRRARLLRLAARYHVPILEDDPYGELRFRGEQMPPLAAFDKEGWVINLGTFSKTLAPGLRIGWVHGPRELVRQLTIAKQSADLHTATLAQRGAAKLLETFDYDAHLGRLRQTYGQRADAMMHALERSMPPGTRWTHPEGGLFLWLALPNGLRDDDVFRAAIERNVAVVPGSGFFGGPAQHGFIRLNYSNQSLARIEEGMQRLGDVISELAFNRPRTGAAPAATSVSP